MHKISPDLFKTKQHFDTLDGLRGVAALAVVIFHFMEFVYMDNYSKNFIGHGYLAVDFFFCLSGFVVAYAYDNRIMRMGLKEFFKSRFIRLQPLVVIGSVLGLIGFYLDPFDAHTITYSFGKMLLIIFCSILVIPFPAMEDRYYNLFGLNCPAWSLFWEYIANILYAFILCRLNRRIVLILLLPAAILLDIVAYKSGNLAGGWGKDNFWDGGARLFYSFLAGMVIYRFNWIIKNKIGFLGVAFLLSIAFLMPYCKYNWLAEYLVVILYFPLLVSLGAGTVSSQHVKKMSVFLGNISYPLYMTHYVGIWIFGHYYLNYKPDMPKTVVVIVVGIFALVGLAYLVMKFYDMPIRKYFKRKRIMST